MCEIILHRPSLGELSFRQRLLKDPETMAYNHAYGGTIDFPRERWSDWYARWVEDETGERFYRCLLCPETGEFVGEAAYHAMCWCPQRSGDRDLDGRGWPCCAPPPRKTV